MKVLVAGGGIGGFSAALALARAGLAVELVEQALVLGEVGAGLQLSPNAMKALAHLGVADAVAENASQPETLELRIGRTGERVFSIPMGAAALARHGAPYLHVHRADLLAALAAAAGEAGVKLRLGARLVRYAHTPDGVEAGLDSGDVLRADLLVGADGLRSHIRQQMLGPRPPRFTGAVAWRGLAPADAAPDLPQAAIVWAGPGRHAVTYRVRKGALINFVGVIEQQEWREEGWAHPGDRTELAGFFADWADPLPQIIARLGAVNRWALFDRDPLPTWSDRRVVLLGDACHPMPPFQAQGAAMAIEDAVVLARRLSANRDAPEAALKAYEAERKPRTSRVLASARSNMAVFHRASPLAQAATYGPMRIADRLLPGFVHGRQDWIYSHDVTRG